MLHLLLVALIVLVVVGFIVWAAESAPFISDSVKPFIRWAAIVIGGFVVLGLLLQMLGIDSPFKNN